MMVQKMEWLMVQKMEQEMVQKRALHYYLMNCRTIIEQILHARLLLLQPSYEPSAAPSE
jgi:hypothetical protein